MVSLFEPGRRKRCCLRCPCRCLPKAVLACLVILCMLSSFGCTLTEDMANLALDAPKTYKYATSTDAGERPSLDWWRGFHSVELTQLMEEAQTVNLDIAAAVSRIFQADAQARQAGAALLPSLSGSGSETYSRTSGSSASGLSIAGSEVVNYSPSLSASYQLDFWGQNRDALRAAEENCCRQPLRPRRGRVDDADERGECLFPGAGVARPAAHDPRQHRKRAARSRCHPGTAQGWHGYRSRCRAAGERPRQPEGLGAAVAADARPEPQCFGCPRVTPAGGRARLGRIVEPDRDPAG